MKKRNGIFYVIIIFLVMELMVQVVIPSVFLLAVGTEIDESHVMGLSNLRQICIFLLATMSIKKTEGQKEEMKRGERRRWGRNLVVICAVLLANSFILDGSRLVRIGLTNDFSLVSRNAVGDMGHFIALILSCGVIPAICEEFFYRKMFYEKLSLLDKKYILFGSGLLFAVAHMSVEKMVPMYILGYVLMKVYINTRSIVDCVVLHMLYNVFEIILTYVIVLPSDTAWISLKYPSGVECVEAGVKYISVAVLFYLVLYWILGEKKQECRSNKGGGENYVEREKEI